MRGLSSILSIFFATNLIHLIIQGHDVRFYLSYDIKITLKSNFCRKNVIFLSLCTQRCYRRHSVSRKSVNLLWCIVLLHGVISLPDATSYAKINCPFVNYSRSKFVIVIGVVQHTYVSRSKFVIVIGVVQHTNVSRSKL